MIKMNDFEQGLANIMGSFMEVNLDCVEKQNQEIEQLQQENTQLKEVIEEVREYAKSHFKTMVADEEAQGLLQILDKAKGE